MSSESCTLHALVDATRNNPSNRATGGATGSDSLTVAAAMTGHELRMQLRAQQARNPCATARSVPKGEVASPEPEAGSAGVARRRARALVILAEHPNRALALVAEAGDPVYIAVAIRGGAMGELTIPADRYDGFALLALMHQYGHEQE